MLDKPATPDAGFDPQHPLPHTGRAPYRIFNIGNSDPVPLMDFIEAIEASLSMTAPEEFSAAASRGCDRNLCRYPRAGCLGGLQAFDQCSRGCRAVCRLVSQLLPGMNARLSSFCDTTRSDLLAFILNGRHTMTQRLPALLCLNAGSSSVKFSLYAVMAGAPSLLLGGQIEGLLGHSRISRLKMRRATPWMSSGGSSRSAGQKPSRPSSIMCVPRPKSYRLVAVGHRVVLGGTEYPHAVVVDDAVLDVLDHYAPIVPSHQPAEIEAIRLLRTLHPDLCQVACFDSAFHRTKSDIGRSVCLAAQLSR